MGVGLLVYEKLAPNLLRLINTTASDAVIYTVILTQTFAWLWPPLHA